MINKTSFLSSVILLLSFLPFFVSASPLDSIGIEKKDGKTFILHKTDPKETLYAISRRYKVTVEEINQNNPEIASGLKEGQIVRIPFKITSNNSAASSTSGTGGMKQHTVEAKETLFSLSRMYGVSVDEIKKANPDLTELKIGQVINIPGKGGEVAKAPEKKDPVKEAKPEPVKPKEVAKEVEEVPVPSSGSLNKVNESGFAEVIEENSDNPKYLALHKTAPVGTIIQVKNENNGQKIFVRVIGKLQGTTGDKVVIKISKKAYERLAGTDNRIPVQISYIP
ncbi:MAG: LysM peptidoglycan-binding domain-containing protein [Cytophagaceae bacterium]